MVYAVYIAAAAVIGLLIGFLALSVLWLKKTVLKNIRSRTLRLISVYDELLEEKSSKLREIERQAARRDEQDKAQQEEQSKLKFRHVSEEAGKAGNAGNHSIRSLRLTKQTGADSYRDPMLGSLYRKLRENFSFNPDEIIQILKESGTQKDESPARKLLKELNPDTVYRLSSLEPETQLDILRESLGTEETKLLDEYMQKHKSFGALDFYDYLLFTAETESKDAILSVPRSICKSSMKLGSTTILPDDEICEGFQLEEDNILYDYCIKARELG